jgi:hypothetical protein
MSTRKLILTALICGLVIVLAGGVKLFQVASDPKQVEVLTLGTAAKLGDMTVSVQGVEQTEQATFVTVTLIGVDGADATEGWRLLSGGAVRAPITVDGVENPCTVTTATQATTCVVVFEPSDGSVTVAYVRAGTQSRWSR